MRETFLNFVNDLITFKELVSQVKELVSQVTLHGWKQPEITRGKIWAVCWMHHHFNVVLL